VNTYAARIEGGTVVQVIVGDPAWAAERLGGVWVASKVKSWHRLDISRRPFSATATICFVGLE
jgi:hypothetical protein